MYQKLSLLRKILKFEYLRSTAKLQTLKSSNFQNLFIDENIFI